MSISAENMKLYPGGSTSSYEWRAIRERIQERAGDRCEKCGVENYLYGYRVDGRFVVVPLATKHHQFLSDVPGHAKPPLKQLDFKLIQIICTTAHMDGKLVDHSDGNLKFLCQYCHLNHDRELRNNAKRGNHG